MHIKYLFVLVTFAILSENTTAQKANFGFDTGYGTYQMTENRQVLKNTMRSIVLQPQCVNDFPGYLFFRPHFEVEFHNVNIGIAYTLMSTGSRYSIRDYSGEYTFDALIKGNSLAAFAEIPVYAYKNLRFLLAAESGIIINQMKIYESLQLQDNFKRQEDNSFKSRNMFLKPYLKAQYKLIGRLNTHITMGYHKDLGSKKMILGGDDLKSKFVSDWDGMRSGIGMSFQL
jgi:hypothetical protein